MILSDLPKGHISGLIRLKARRVDTPHEKRKEEATNWKKRKYRHDDERENVSNSENNRHRNCCQEAPEPQEASIGNRDA